jgi:hypothetical protein
MSWLSKAIGKSKSKGTGIFSWGSSPTVRAMISKIPLAGDLLNAGLGALSKSSGKAQRTATSAKTGESWIHIS